jgi:1,2-diacylglycerol 3-alpha-glucosyltransferase
MFTDSWETDGVSNSIRISKKGLESRGHKVRIFAASPDDKKGWHGDVFYFKGFRFPFYKSYNLCFMPDDITKELDGIDVIHVHTPAFIGVKGMVAAYRLGIPSVFTYHTDFLAGLRIYVPYIPSSVLVPLGKAFLNYFVKDFDAIIFPSVYTKSTASWLKVRSSHVFPTGIDSSSFRLDGSSCIPVSLDEALNNGKKVVLTVGRVAKEKNLELLFESMSHLSSEYVLFVAGRGPLLDHYKSKYSSPRIRFLGFVPQRDLPAVYAAADCFVITSKFDTQGMVVHEAMSTGLPVAALNHGAMPEFVDSTCGRLFEEDAESLAESIVNVALSRKALSGGAFAAAKRNNIDVFVDRLENVYDSVL